MPDDLIHKDAYAWSLAQADRLRRLRAGERVNDLDWDNIIEEIESVGGSEIEKVRSQLGQAVLHLMKRRGWPESESARRWRADAADFLVQAQDAYRPSMAQKMELDRLRSLLLRRFALIDADTPPLPWVRLAEIPIEAVADGAFSVDALDAALFPEG